MPIEALIFDLDGTLVDTAPDLLLATNYVLAKISRPPLTMAQLRTYVGHGAMNLIDLGVKASGPAVSQDTLHALHVDFLEYYGANIAVKSVMFDGLRSVLTRASERGLKLGVCTNKVEKLSNRLLAELGVADLFGAVVGGDTLPVMKPDPTTYREVARRLGIDPLRTLMFGDSETDIKTAKNAGVPVIAVTFGYTSRPVQEFDPDHTIDHYDKAWPLIEKYLG